MLHRLLVRNNAFVSYHILLKLLACTCTPQVSMYKLRLLVAKPYFVTYWIFSLLPYVLILPCLFLLWYYTYNWLEECCSYNWLFIYKLIKIYIILLFSSYLIFFSNKKKSLQHRCQYLTLPESVCYIDNIFKKNCEDLCQHWYVKLFKNKIKHETVSFNNIR